MWHKACMSSQCKTHSQVVNCNKNLAMTAQHDHLDRASAFTLLKILFMQSLKVGVHVCASTVGTACLFNISFFYHHNCSLAFAFSNPHTQKQTSNLCMRSLICGVYSHTVSCQSIFVMQVVIISESEIVHLGGAMRAGHHFHSVNCIHSIVDVCKTNKSNLPPCRMDLICIFP